MISVWKWWYHCILIVKPMVANIRKSNLLMVSKRPRARASSIVRQKKGIFKMDLMSLGRAHNLSELLVQTRCRGNSEGMNQWGRTLTWCLILLQVDWGSYHSIVRVKSLVFWVIRTQLKYIQSIVCMSGWNYQLRAKESQERVHDKRKRTYCAIVAQYEIRMVGNCTRL